MSGSVHELDSIDSCLVEEQLREERFVLMQQHHRHLIELDVDAHAYYACQLFKELLDGRVLVEKELLQQSICVVHVQVQRSQDVGIVCLCQHKHER